MILMHGCCLDKMKELTTESVDLILTDPPYGTTNCKWDSVIDLNLMWVELKRIIKPCGAILLMAQTPFDKVLGCSNIEQLRYEWIYEKTAATGHLNAKKMPMKAHENILVFYKKLPTYNFQKTQGHNPVHSYKKKVNNDGEIYGKTTTTSGGGNTDRYPRSIQRFKSEIETKASPNAKASSVNEVSYKDLQPCRGYGVGFRYGIRNRRRCVH